MDGNLLCPPVHAVEITQLHVGVARYVLGHQDKVLYPHICGIRVSPRSVYLARYADFLRWYKVSDIEDNHPVPVF